MHQLSKLEVKYAVGPSILLAGTGDLVSEYTVRPLIAPTDLPRIRGAGHVIPYSTYTHIYFKSAFSVP